MTDISSLASSVEKLGSAFAGTTKKSTLFGKAIRTLTKGLDLATKVAMVWTALVQLKMRTALDTTTKTMAATASGMIGLTQTTVELTNQSRVVGSHLDDLSQKYSHLANMACLTEEDVGGLTKKVGDWDVTMHQATQNTEALASGVAQTGVVAAKTGKSFATLGTWFTKSRVAAMAFGATIGILIAALAAVIVPTVLACKAVKKLVTVTWDLAVALKDRLVSAVKSAAAHIEDFVTRTLSALASKLKTLAIGAIKNLIDYLKELDASVEGVGYNFELLADRAGIGGAAMLQMMQDASSGMATNLALMKNYNTATLGVSEVFAETLPQALMYFGQVAMATGISIDYLLESYVKGVQKLSPIILDNLNIQVSLAEASGRAARMFEVEEKALTKAQKQAGMTVVVLNKLAEATQGLPSPIGTLAQKLAMITVGFKNLKDTMMIIFLPAAKAVADVVIALLGYSGALSKPLRYLSATITVLAEELLKLVNSSKKAGQAFLENFGDKMIETAWRALQWGANIITNLAIGIVRGGSTVLVAAINWIGRILAHWLAPGSAPRIAPDLAKWGLSAFATWLHGFASGGFDVLETLQAPLERALRVLMGENDSELGETFAEISRAMAEYLAGGSSLETVLARLTDVGSEYGTELATLFQKMLALADATAAVEASERRLADARRRYETHQTKLTEGAREYNRMLREGASSAQLAAKMKQLKADYAAMKTAEKEITAEEQALEIAKEQLEATQKQARAQEQLLNQLLKIAEIMAKATKKDKDGEDGEGPITFPEIDIGPGITSIDTAFDALKERIRQKLQELWGEIKKTWDESGAGRALAWLAETWNTFLETKLIPWWDNVFMPWLRTSAARIEEVGVWQWLEEEAGKAFDGLVNWLISLLPESLQTFVESWGITWENVKNTFLGVVTTILDFFSGLVLGFGDYGDEMLTAWNGVVTQFGVAGNLLKKLFRVLGLEGEKSVAKLVGALVGKLAGYAVVVVLSAISGVIFIINSLLAAITVCIGFVRKLAEGFGLYLTIIHDAVEYRIGAIKFAFSELRHNVGKAFEGIRSTISEKVQAVKNIFNGLSNKVNWISDRIRDKFDRAADSIRSIRDWFQRLWDKARDVFNYLSRLSLPWWLTPGSPTPLEMGIRGISKALKAMPAMNFAPIGGAGAGSTSVIHVTNNFGPGSVRSNKDIQDIADAITHSLHLAGVKTGV